jgi:hypothetical protein
MAREPVAYNGTTYQLLPLPYDGHATQSASRDRFELTDPHIDNAPRAADPARHPISSTDPRTDLASPESVRHILRDLLGR